MEPAGRIELPHFPYEGKGLPLTYAGIWWALWDSNPGSTGYEPGAVTISAKGPQGVIKTPLSHINEASSVGESLNLLKVHSHRNDLLEVLLRFLLLFITQIPKLFFVEINDDMLRL